MAHVAGLKQFALNGIINNVVGSVTYSVGGEANETATGLDGPHGPMLKYKAPFVELTIRHALPGGGHIDMKSLNLNPSNQFYADCADGTQLAGADMWVVDIQTVNVDEGSFSLRLEGTTGSLTEN